MYPTRLQQQLEQGIKSRQCKVCGWRLFLDWITFNPVSYASVLCHPSPLLLLRLIHLMSYLLFGDGGLPGWSRSSLYLYGRALNLNEFQQDLAKKVEHFMLLWLGCSLNGPFYNRKVTKIGSLDKRGCSFLNESLGFLNTMLREIPWSTLSMKKWVFNIILFSLQPP